MKGQLHLYRLAALVALLALTAGCPRAERAGDPGRPSPMLGAGDAMPTLDVAEWLNETAPHELLGQVVVLDVFASW